MVLVPRHVDVENVLCKHDELSGTAEAGAIVKLTAANKVAVVSGSGAPFAMLGQKVKAQAAGLPQNFEFPGEIGTSDARLGDPVLLFHGGVFETTHYNLPSGVAAGAALYAELGDGKLITTTGTAALDLLGAPAICAIAQSALSTAEAAAAKRLVVKLQLA